MLLEADMKVMDASFVHKSWRNRAGPFATSVDSKPYNWKLKAPRREEDTLEGDCTSERRVSYYFLLGAENSSIESAVNLAGRSTLAIGASENHRWGMNRRKQCWRESFRLDVSPP